MSEKADLNSEPTATSESCGRLGLTLAERCWWRVQVLVNKLAWRVAPLRAGDYAKHPLWRLNDWLADQWLPAWSERVNE